MKVASIQIKLSPYDAEQFEKRKQAPDSMFYAAGQREKERILAAAFAEAGIDRAAGKWDYTLETTTINIFPDEAAQAFLVSDNTATTEALPVAVLLRLECRGRRGSHDEWYQVQVSKAADATIEDFKPYVLEKTSEAFGSVMVKRTCLRVEQYDPAERSLLVSYSLPASKASDFGFELWYGYGFKRVSALGATAR